MDKREGDLDVYGLVSGQGLGSTNNDGLQGTRKPNLFVRRGNLAEDLVGEQEGWLGADHQDALQSGVVANEAVNLFGAEGGEAAFEDRSSYVPFQRTTWSGEGVGRSILEAGLEAWQK